MGDQVLVGLDRRPPRRTDRGRRAGRRPVIDLGPHDQGGAGPVPHGGEGDVDHLLLGDADLDEDGVGVGRADRGRHLPARIRVGPRPLGHADPAEAVEHPGPDITARAPGGRGHHLDEGRHRTVRGAVHVLAHADQDGLVRAHRGHGPDGSGAMIAPMTAKDERSVSWWMETGGDDLTPRPPLDGSTTADVAILGAGYTGLWTALYLLERDPSLNVVLVEREIAGWGASGRNGGWLSPQISVSHTEMIARHGKEATRATHDALIDTIGHVESAVERHGIDAHLDRHGMLMLARGGHQMKSAPPHLRRDGRARVPGLLPLDGAGRGRRAGRCRQHVGGPVRRALRRRAPRSPGAGPGPGRRRPRGHHLRGHRRHRLRPDRQARAAHDRRRRHAPTSSSWRARPTSPSSRSTAGRSSPSTPRSCSPPR